MDIQRTYTIDLNADLGEGAANDEAILALVSSANIACGGHTGDEHTMRTAMRLAKKYGVAIGAHPSFVDKEHFGRQTMHPPMDQLYEQLKTQIQHCMQIAKEEGVFVRYVKAHGALYNQSAQDAALATLLIQVIQDCDRELHIMGLAGSALIDLAQQQKLSTIEEAFADRRYNAHGSLVPRNEENACIDNVEEALQQCLSIVQQQHIQSIDHQTIALHAQSICVHGDGEHALTFVRYIHNRFRQENIMICSPYL